MVTPKMPMDSVEEKARKFIRGGATSSSEASWRFSVTLDKAHYDELKTMADEERRSVTKQAELCIINALKARRLLDPSQKS